MLVDRASCASWSPGKSTGSHHAKNWSAVDQFYYVCGDAKQRTRRDEVEDRVAKKFACSGLQIDWA